jgi:hypothetical protein
MKKAIVLAKAPHNTKPEMTKLIAATVKANK